MKKYYYTTLILAISLFYACAPETELLFDKSASERMSETLNDYQELLVSGSDGWLVEYYPHSSRTYGGYNLFFRFSEEEVFVRSEVESSLLTEDESAGYYSLGEDMGPTLNFDSYNSVFHYFSDPALDVGGGTGYGLEGDYEFVFISGDASEIILRGKKTKNSIRLTPMTVENWEQYRAGVLAMQEAFTASMYSMTVGGREVTSITKPLAAYNRFEITYEENGDGEQVTADMAYVTTATGIRFYEPLTIAGITMQEFTFDSTSNRMVSNDGDAAIYMEFPPVEDVFVNSLSSSQWFFSSGAMGGGFLSAFNAIKTGLETSLAHQLAFAWIGLSVQNSLPSFSYATTPDGSTAYYGSTLINVSKVEEEEGRITINATTSYEVNGEVLTSYVPAIQQFVNSLQGEYAITTADPLNNVTQVTLTDPEDESRTFTLTLSVVTYP